MECTQFNCEVFVGEQITVPRRLEHSLKFEESFGKVPI